jgi:hypothetical protein
VEIPETPADHRILVEAERLGLLSRDNLDEKSGNQGENG